MIIYSTRIVRFYQQEIGIAGIHLADHRQCSQIDCQPLPQLHQRPDHVVDLLHFFESLEHQLLRGLADIVGRFDLIQNLDNSLACKSHTYTKTRQTPGLAKCLQNYQIGIIAQLLDKAAMLRKIDVGFVDYHHTGKIVQDDLDVLAVHGIGRRIVGAADPDQLRVLIHQVLQVYEVQLKIIEQHRPPDLDVIDVRADLIHAIGRRIDDHIVLTRHTKGPE